MKILVTGGTGFQGSHLVRHLLKQGHDITILNTWSDRSQANLEDIKDDARIIWGSITDKEIVDKSVRDQDVVFNLAARVNVDESIEDPLSYIEVNVKGTYNILEAVTKQEKRLIHASTCEVYGAPLGNGILDEHAELRPHSPYAASKAGADRLCFAYYKTYGTNVTIVRPFNIFGERQKEGPGGALIAIFTRLALEGKPLRVFGSGDQTRDYLHINDLVKAYELVFTRNGLAGEVINFGTGIETSIKDIAEYIGKALNAEVQYVESRRGEVKHFGANCGKAEKLGFKPEVDIWEGIDQYIEWKKSQ